jgi:hypothetical protein
MTSKAARRIRKRSLTICLCLVALNATCLFAAVDQLHTRAALLQKHCDAPQEKIGADPIVTTAVKLQNPPLNALGDEPGDLAPLPWMAVSSSDEPKRTSTISTNTQAVSDAASNRSDLPATTGALTSSPSEGRLTRVETVRGTRRGVALNTSPPDHPACPTTDLNDVLADVSSRFGELKIVATDHHKTPNHRSGSLRQKLHLDCRAVDFRPDPARIKEIKTYLQARQDIGGVESYRDGVIHFDLVRAPGSLASSRRPPSTMN